MANSIDKVTVGVISGTTGTCSAITAGDCTYTIIGKQSTGNTLLWDSAVTWDKVTPEKTPAQSCSWCGSRGQIESHYHPGTCCNCGGLIGKGAPEINKEDLMEMRAAFVDVTDAMDKGAKMIADYARSLEDAGIGFYGASSVLANVISG